VANVGWDEDDRTEVVGNRWCGREEKEEKEGDDDEEKEEDNEENEEDSEEKEEKMEEGVIEGEDDGRPAVVVGNDRQADIATKDHDGMDCNTNTKELDDGVVTINRINDDNDDQTDYNDDDARIAVKDMIHRFNKKHQYGENDNNNTTMKVKDTTILLDDPYVDDEEVNTSVLKSENGEWNNNRNDNNNVSKLTDTATDEHYADKLNIEMEEVDEGEHNEKSHVDKENRDDHNDGASSDDHDNTEHNCGDAVDESVECLAVEKIRTDEKEDEICAVKKINTDEKEDELGAAKDSTVEMIDTDGKQHETMECYENLEENDDGNRIDNEIECSTSSEKTTVVDDANSNLEDTKMEEEEGVIDTEDDTFEDNPNINPSNDETDNNNDKMYSKNEDEKTHSNDETSTGANNTLGASGFNNNNNNKIRNDSMTTFEQPQPQMSLMNMAQTSMKALSNHFAPPPTPVATTTSSKQKYEKGGNGHNDNAILPGRTSSTIIGDDTTNSHTRSTTDRPQHHVQQDLNRSRNTNVSFDLDDMEGKSDPFYGDSMYDDNIHNVIRDDYLHDESETVGDVSSLTTRASSLVSASTARSDDDEDDDDDTRSDESPRSSSSYDSDDEEYEYDALDGAGAEVEEEFSYPNTGMRYEEAPDNLYSKEDGNIKEDEEEKSQSNSDSTDVMALRTHRSDSSSPTNGTHSDENDDKNHNVNQNGMRRSETNHSMQSGFGTSYIEEL